MDAEIAEALSRGISPGVSDGARRARCSSAEEFRARRRFNEAVAAFTSNLLDIADITGVYRDELLEFRKTVLTQREDHLTQWEREMFQADSDAQAAGKGGIK